MVEQGNMSEQQIPTTQELTEFSLRAFKGIEAGLGQADPTAGFGGASTEE